MAMIECSECGAKVSDRARACPQCGGNPDSAAVKFKKSALRIAITLGVLFIILLFWTRCTAWLYGFD